MMKIKAKIKKVKGRYDFFQWSELKIYEGYNEGLFLLTSYIVLDHNFE